MAIVKSDLENMSKLSRLSFTPEEEEQLIKEFNQILNHVDMINTVDTDGVAPCSNIFSLSNALREDEIKPSMPPDKLLSNAPSVEDTAYLVPNVVE